MSLKVYGIGRLTKEPELRYTQSNKAVLTIDLAFDRGFGDNKQTDFIPVVFWEGRAETISKFCNKGDRLLIEGEIQVRQWQTKEKENRNTTEVRCYDFTFIESAKKQEDSVAQPFYEEQSIDIEPTSFEVDDLPF